MVKKSKGKPKKPAAAPRRDNRVKASPRSAAARKRAIAELRKVLPPEFAPAKPRRKRVAKSLKGSLRPKVSLFLNRATLNRAKHVAGRASMPLTALLEQFVEKGLGKKAA